MLRTWIADSVHKVGEQITLQGWVHTRRNMGKLIFIDLRDQTGVCQVVFLPNHVEALTKAAELGNEFVVEIVGQVNTRPAKQVKADVITGTIEIEAFQLNIISPAATPPFEIEDEFKEEVNEELRLQYRYLDLRRTRLHRNLIVRSEFVRHCRDFLYGNNFVEIETPLLTKSTPEGSRDFIVPSRHYPGSFYALPQSPQQYKQLLVGAGFERYFQLARALRDEDLRADRGYEHTQIDLEMAFVQQADVMATVEQMMIQTVEAMGYTVKQKPFPRFTYAEAMAQFGADKFDLRTPEEKQSKVLAYAWVTDFPFFETTDDASTGSGWTFTHNPFSMPKAEHVDWLLQGKNIEQIITQQYDLVCNGYESGGGSIRAHQPEILRATYQVMGYSAAEIEASIGHMLEAFRFGFPPHGGIALGVERNIMNLTGESYLREVQAFPMTSQGRTAVMSAPAPITAAQLHELNITIQQ
ncbi:MAG: aspartate--tRNA ligase [Candidatus Kerfeldbacteria bacterium]|nr:aspartate--tRNA ligase [Candidatus Kerfeldbacteria bacterium]